MKIALERHKVKTMEVLISIIVPVYNTEKYLKDCVDSLVGQTYENVEIILVDDGSTDNSPSLCDTFAEKDGRVKVIHKVNGGLSDARNTGMSISEGEYIMFVDSDDWLDKKTCEELLREAELEVSDIVMCSYTKEFGTHSIENSILEIDKIVYSGNEVRGNIQRRLFGPIDNELSSPQNCDLLVSACMQLFSRKVIGDIKFVDTKKIGTEDLLFQTEVYSDCDRFVYLDKPYYHYRRSESGTLTTKYMPEKFERWQNLYDILFDLIEKQSFPEAFREALSNRIALGVLGLGLNESYSPEGIFKQSKRMKEILGTERYKEVFKKLPFGYFPIHWRVFYLLCKYRLTFPLMLMLHLIEFLRKRVK